MTSNEPFRFKSKILKGKTTGLAAMINMSGGQGGRVGVNELLALAGVNGDTPIEEVNEARAELKAVFAAENHPFWYLNDYMQSEEFARISAEVKAKEKAKWDALSTSKKVKYYLRETALAALGIFLFWVIFF